MGIWLSYSAYSQYKKCPKQYDYQRVSKTEPPVKESRHNAVIGSVVQSTFEDFYNEEIWRKRGGAQDDLIKRSEKYFQKFMEENYVDFDDVTSRFDSKAEPLNEIYEIIPKTISAIKREKLIGPYAKSEKEFKVRHKKDFLYGYVDFLIRDSNDNVILLDGKSSRYREERVDETQLYYYALMFYKKYKKLPDKMGFLYFRFGDDEEEAFDWIEDISKEKLSELKSDIDEVIFNIRNYEFQADPNPKWCKWCPWESICDERLEQKKKNRMKRKFRSKKEEIETSDSSDTIGFDAIED